ncbi:hypothetical protein UP09_07860 [Bradyrhizobium sp. LTSP885]|uniref:hypothetical protein n=1 Tax=Bradyrhizobium sp. LTSP885 TaxID=1619232 RepID=UPI0005C96D93|nr:hypothetical protein [Bradyrhizobium sp. LTSP885]KJC49133.1 hypothetical protein UP09_07860 [Bradyrhizobium sp. LTSP885]
MSDPLAKLITLTARLTQTPGETDRLVIASGGIEFEGPFPMNAGDVFDFDDQDLVPFSGQLQLDLIAEHPGQQPANLGPVIIRADEQGRGELTQQFRGSGALYDLAYKVI